MLEPRGVRALGELADAACRVIADGYAIWRGDQAVLCCIAISSTAARCQVAAAVIAQCCAASTGQLVQAVGGVSAVDIVKYRVPGTLKLATG